MARIQLTHEDVNAGSPVEILASSVNISGKKLNTKTPEANGDNLAYAQTQGFENFVYAINNVHFTGQAGYLDWDDVIALYKSKFTGGNAIKLVITYGSTDLLKGLNQSTDIYVVLESVSMNVSAEDSRNAYRPTATLTFVETRTS